MSNSIQQSFIQDIKQEGNEKDVIINGVSVSQMFKTTEKVKNNTNLSKFKFQAKGKWISGGYNQTGIRDFYGMCQTHSRETTFVYDSDEPQVLFGNDSAATPLEYVLIGLNSCLTTAFIYNASAQGIKIDELESTLEGIMDIRGAMGLSDYIRNGYESIKVSFKVKSSATDEKLKELIKLAQERSPVFDIVSNPTLIDVSLLK